MPASHDGSLCAALDANNSLMYDYDEGMVYMHPSSGFNCLWLDCGAIFSKDDFADRTEEHATLTTLEDENQVPRLHVCRNSRQR